MKEKVIGCIAAFTMLLDYWRKLLPAICSYLVLVKPEDRLPTPSGVKKITPDHQPSMFVGLILSISSTSEMYL